jgi:hypothetical protein
MRVTKLLLGSFAGFALLLVLTAWQSESELSKLMRNMSNDMKRIRVKVQEGQKIPQFYKKYGKIHTAKPSVDSKKGEEFPEMATAFLKQCERLGSSDKSQLKIEYNNLVQSCIRCHEKYCPGPITMLKRLKLP